MKCNCRLQDSDMGYYECQLEVNHIGNHSYYHNGETWPKRKYTITWEKDIEKDIIFTEQMLLETNINDVFNNIKEKFKIDDINYDYNDDPLTGSTPSIWIQAKWNEEIVDSIECCNIVWDLETEIRKYIDENLIYNNRLLSTYDEMLNVFLNIY